MAVDHLMGARREKARRELPLLHPDGVLRLVAVALRPGRRQDRLHFQFDPADATQVLLDEGLLVAQLRLIGDVPEDAAAAPAAHRTVGGTRSGEEVKTCSIFPKQWVLLTLTSRTSSRSPTAEAGTKTAMPSKCPTPLPSWVISVTSSVTQVVLPRHPPTPLHFGQSMLLLILCFPLNCRLSGYCITVFGRVQPDSPAPIVLPR